MGLNPLLLLFSRESHRALYLLGPLLFLIYIDDLPGVVQNFLSKVNLFADDILLYHLISVLEDYATLQRAISLIEEWSITNFLNFNAAKCKYMIISRKRSPPPEYPLRLFGCPMQSVDCYKYLGLLITNNLTWSTHIDSICSRAKKILGLIYRWFYSSANQDTTLLSSSCTLRWSVLTLNTVLQSKRVDFYHRVVFAVFCG